MKIFVSSTYLDLKEHRKAVDEIINRLGAQCRGMEYFGARPFEPKKVCFEEIDQCDIFVGIYAHRYGSIPKGDQYSITEQEFDYARRKGLACYCYVVDPTHPWPPTNIEVQATHKLERFLGKVQTLVISTFTTPDNLAKQVAADLKSATGKALIPSDIKRLRNALQAHVKQEITTTVGPKYIRALYVGRKLHLSLQKELKRLEQLPLAAKSIAVDCEEIRGILSSINVSNLEKEKQDFLMQSIGSLRNAFSILDPFGNLSCFDEEFCYPADRFTSSLAIIKDILLNCQRNIPFRTLTDAHVSSRWDSTSYNLLDTINNIQPLVRPILLIVDRAGGGKTNLLCRLAEDIGHIQPCFFITAKAITYPNEKTIIEYLSSTYPIGEDPIEVAMGVITQTSAPVVVIIDGINEGLDPFGFNSAFKALVRRYYSRPIRFIVSCRDIYWTYFEDDWWLSHCSLISRDELYEFTEREYRKALPLYLHAYDIDVVPVGDAREQLHHPLLLRFFCEAFKGLPGKPARMGTVGDIRLLELFDAYCNRKFSQIAQRLNLLSGEEVFDYLQSIAKLMLTQYARALPVRKVAHKITEEFGEAAIRSVDSRYVQILDEDILLEQKPSGPEMDLMVSFVYEEFMEYVIAKALWAEATHGVRSPGYKQIQSLTEGLLEQEHNFISVLGIVVYLGGLLARHRFNDTLRYIDWLLIAGRESIACRLIPQCPPQMRDDALFSKLIDIHKRVGTGTAKLEAWKAMERLCHHHWNVFFDYVTKMQLTGYFRPMFVFSALARVNGGVKPNQQLKSIQWIVRVMKNDSGIYAYRATGDYRNGIGAIKRIIANARANWSDKQLKKAEELLRGVEQL